jgi:hypothetical protein
LYTTRAEVVRWVSESLRPFEMVNDRGFQKLMKTGRLEYYLPFPSIVAHDVKQDFIKSLLPAQENELKQYTQNRHKTKLACGDKN